LLLFETGNTFSGNTWIDPQTNDFRKPETVWVLYRNSNSPYIERHLEDIETMHVGGECCSRAI